MKAKISARPPYAIPHMQVVHGRLAVAPIALGIKQTIAADGCVITTVTKAEGVSRLELEE